MTKTNVFILGARGYTKNYGGWEAFVQGLINNWKDNKTKFFVYEIVHSKEEEKIEIVNGVTCFRIYIEQTGYSAMMIFDAKSMFHARAFVKEHKVENPIMYVLGPRDGPLFRLYRPILKKEGFTILENPAGLEWRRSKWNWAVQQYVKVSAYTMATASDYLVCDSEGIVAAYNDIVKGKRPHKVFIPYGSYPAQKLDITMPPQVKQYFDKHDMKPGEYYLVLGRFVPENNYEMMINGFMKAQTKKKLIIICNVEKNKFYESLREKTKFDQDERIKIVGAMYDKEILNYVRQLAHAYIHGHSVGGTNPGLLEAMSATDVNLLFNCVFNKEVGQDSALYFDDAESLAKLVNRCEHITEEEKKKIGVKAKERMKKEYSWDKIVCQYEKLFKRIRDKK